MSFEYILFDLDGTLTDSAEGIVNSVIYALRKFSIEISDKKELYKFLGAPLWDCFKNYYRFSDEKTNIAVEYYREYFRDKGIFENSLYEGIDHLLKKLKDNSKVVILATSKPEVYAKQILEYFDIAKYFTHIAGSCLDGTRVKKCEVIKYALESCNIKDMSKAIMIGDREHDIIGAKKVGISSMGVLYGYGDRCEHEKAGADYLVDKVEDVENIILQDMC